MGNTTEIMYALRRTAEGLLIIVGGTTMAGVVLVGGHVLAHLAAAIAAPTVGILVLLAVSAGALYAATKTI